MKSIVIPVNHEPASLLAVECAAQIGRSVGVSNVLLVNVKSPRHQDRAGAQLAKGRAILEGYGIRASTVRLEGRKGRRIVDLCHEDALIVMAKLAGTDRSSWEIGVTTVDVLKLAPCPVLVVTDQLTPLAHPLFAYNGSPQSRRAVITALDLLAPKLIKGGSVVAVTDDDHMGERLAAEVADLAARSGVELSAPCIRAGKPGDVVLDRRAEVSADLVVMGAYGRRWLRQLVFGSTTEAMLRQCPVPIWMAS